MKPVKPKSATKAFEEALAHRQSDDGGTYILRLYVSGQTPRSQCAIQNIRSICDERLPGRYELQVIDIYQHPSMVRPEDIVVTPTLIKSLPAPVRRIIGDLSNTERVLVGLDIERRPEAPRG
jgi:circadian clock protein KaiB